MAQGTKATEYGISALHSPIPPPGFTPAREPMQKTKRVGGDAHLPKSTLAGDPMEIKVVQADFAFKVDGSGETTAHIASAGWGWGGAAATKERKGIRCVRSVLMIYVERVEG